jgi:hypothetical protein
MRKIFILLLPLTLALGACNSVDGASTYNYDDAWAVHRHARGDAALQADTRSCIAKSGGEQNYGGPRFNACMRARGWKPSVAELANSSSDSSPNYDNSAPNTDSSDAANAANDAVNQENATNEATAAAQQMNNDAMAAAQQTMNNANQQ